MLRYSETRAVSCRLQRLSPKFQAKYLNISLSPWPVQILSESQSHRASSTWLWSCPTGTMSMACCTWAVPVAQSTQVPFFPLFHTTLCEHRGVRGSTFPEFGHPDAQLQLDFQSGWNSCPFSHDVWLFTQPWLTFCLLLLKEQTRTRKDSEEIRWGKRTLRLQKTLQVPVLDCVIRYQKLVLISAGPC